jgi:hypothetical protein
MTSVLDLTIGLETGGNEVTHECVCWLTFSTPPGTRFKFEPSVVPTTIDGGYLFQLSNSAVED